MQFFSGKRKSMNKPTKALLLLLTISGSALADDAGIRRCRGILEPTTRLACYDALTIPAAEARMAPSSPVAASPKVAPTAVAAPAPAVTAPKPVDQFGLENRPNPAALDAIESTIPGRFEGWDSRSNIRLANGQVWQIADDSSRYVTMNDPKVRIRRGALGAFYLEFEKMNHSPRVRRVQ